MRKFMAGLIIGAVLATTAGVFAGSEVRLIVNGKEVAFPDAPPQILNGRTMVPARPLAEALGATVTWDSEKRAVVVSTGEARSADWLGAKELFDAYGVQARSDGHAIRLSANGKWAEYPMNAPEISGVTDSGTAVRGKMENSRFYANVTDLRTAGLLSGK